MARPRPERKQRRLSVDEVRLLLPDCQVVNVKWVLTGLRFTEMQPTAWALIHVLARARTHGMFLSGAGATAAGWGLRSRQPGKGWLYFETRHGRGKGGYAGPVAF